MKNRLRRQRPVGICSTEGLETRHLLSVGTAGLTNIVQNLGTVTRSAAAAGIEVTAQIPANHAISFAFNVQTADTYTLVVGHVGRGLTLNEITPTGTTTIDPGPSGKFETFTLPLGAHQYVIKAAAEGGEGVFVDWELLLNNGVGQSAATVPSAILGLNTAASTTTTSGSPSSATPSANSPISGPTNSSATSAVVAMSSNAAENPPIYLVGEPVGRPSLDSPSALPALAATPAKTSAGVQKFLAELDTALVTAMQSSMNGQAETAISSVTDPEVPIERSWFGDLAGTTSSSIPTELTPAEAELAQFLAHYQNLPEGDDQQVSLSSISPGILVGAVAVTVAARGRIKKMKQGLGRGIPVQAGKITPKVGHRCR